MAHSNACASIGKASDSDNSEAPTRAAWHAAGGKVGQGAGAARTAWMDSTPVLHRMHPSLLLYCRRQNHACHASTCLVHSCQCLAHATRACALGPPTTFSRSGNTADCSSYYPGSWSSQLELAAWHLRAALPHRRATHCCCCSCAAGWMWTQTPTRMTRRS